MISNRCIESFLDCKYKTYLLQKGQIGAKKDFEIMTEEIKNNVVQDFRKLLIQRYGEQNIVRDFEFNLAIHGKKQKLAMPLTINDKEYSLDIDGLEIHFGKNVIKYGKYVTLLFSEKNKISKREKLFLTIQSIFLSRMTGLNFVSARVYYGKEMKTLKFKIARFIPESLRIINDIEKIVSRDFEPAICKKDHCKICEFEEGCKIKLTEKDDLSLLSCIGEKELAQYEKKGIFSVKQLSYTFKPRKRNEKIKNNRNPHYASLQALAIREKKVYVYDSMQLPFCETRVYLDFEGDTESNSIYLIGILIEKESGALTYSLWANSKEGEQFIFNELTDILTGLKDPYIFYYGKYDWRIIKRISSKITNPQLVSLLLEKSIDVLGKIRRNIYFPTYSNSLKDIGHFLGCGWSNQLSSGLQSIVWRYKWEKSKDEAFKNTLIQYNKEDCMVLKALVNFLYTITKITPKENSLQQLNNVFFVKNLESKEPRQFKNMEYALPEIEVITKGAYFEYQRNKIYFRTNKNLKKLKKIKEKKDVIRYKANKVVHIKATRCTKCHNKNLTETGMLFTKTCTDLKFFNSGIKKWIIKYESPLYECSICGHKFASKLFKKIKTYARRGYNRKSYYLLRNQKGYGQGVISYIIYQNVVGHVPFGVLQRHFKDFFKLHLLKSDVWGFKIIAANYYKETYNNIIRGLVKGNLLHADETKVKLRNANGYVWVFSNMEDVVYLYKPSRESNFLQELLNGFNGVLVSDFYPGYDSLACKKQRCLIHLIRDLNDELLKNPFDDELKDIVSSFGLLIREIIATSDRYGLKSRFLRRHKKQVQKFFQSLKRKEIKSEISDKVKKRLIDYETELFTFLEYDGIPWNNNNAEYAIKHFAEYRSSMKGIITENGLEAYLVLLSVYQTCNYKGINFLEFLLSKEKDIDRFSMLKNRKLQKV